MEYTKDTYTKKEVAELIVKNNNNVMSLIDRSKYFKIEGDEVVCYRKGLLKDRELSRYSIDYVIAEVAVGIGRS